MTTLDRPTVTSSGRSTRCCRDGFTLVELLVVIGIIALLISILLPALNNARRSANAVKCETQLRELGNAFRYYQNDNRGYYPPALMNPSGVNYEIDGTKFGAAPGVGNAYWYNFINRYISKNNVGKAAIGTQAQASARQGTVIWGCSEWDPYTNSSSEVQTGYGYNYIPTFTSSYPTGGGTPGFDATGKQNNMTELATSPDAGWTTATQGTFLKATLWNRHSSERLLLSDARFYIAQSQNPPATGILPLQPGASPSVLFTTSTSGETTLSLWRHSKLPTIAKMSGSVPYFDSNKGKIAFNALYCDGHVVTSSDAKEAYRSIRMKFPG